MKPSEKALIVIDVQNDYFPGGKLPLWNAEETLGHIVNAISDAGKQGIDVILVKHIADKSKGSGFFIPGTTGADIHPDILKAAPDAPVVVKHRADAFNGTNLNAVLDKSGIEEILICGMQTQNCVGLSAISKNATPYKPAILSDCCTAETKTVHAIALAGFGDIVPVVTASLALC